ncbi:uncharacterized protein ISCGN_022441 [Ixodes scapularis]
MRALQAAYPFLADSTGRCVPHHEVEGTDNCADHIEIMAAECPKAATDVKLLLQTIAQTSQARRCVEPREQYCTRHGEQDCFQRLSRHYSYFYHGWTTRT